MLDWKLFSHWGNQGSHLFQYPMTMNYIMETCPEAHWAGEEVNRASLYTSAAFGISFTLSTVLYAV